MKIAVGLVAAATLAVPAAAVVGAPSGPASWGATAPAAAAADCNIVTIPLDPSCVTTSAPAPTTTRPPSTTAPPGGTTTTTTAAPIVTTPGGGTVTPGQPPPAGSSSFTAIAPVRLADTRASDGAFGFTRLDANVIRVVVAGRNGIPQNATAAVLNIASVNSTGKGFVTAYPAETQRPLASSLNVDARNAIIANLATVRLGAGGAVDLYTLVPMDLVVDVVGAYTPATRAVSAGRLVTIAGGAKRVLDTRQRGALVAPGSTETVPLAAAGVPNDASAVVVNVAATETVGPGYWVAFPGGDRPLASSLNVDAPGQTRNALSIVALNRGAGSFAVYSQSGGHLVVDVVGWFTGGSSPASFDGLFVPNAPLRVLDSRERYSDLPPWGGSALEFDPHTSVGGLRPDQVSAVAINLATAEALDLGFITGYPAGVKRPLAANLNITTYDQIISNHAIVRAGTRGVALFTYSAAQMIVDVAGWYLGNPEQSVDPPPVNPEYGPTRAYSINVGAVGIQTEVGYGSNQTATLNYGAAVLYSGSGLLGVSAENSYFAHRTSAGAPFLRLNEMNAGLRFDIVGEDGHIYRYRVVTKAVILPYATELEKTVRSSPGKATIALVACDPPHSTRYRLVVVGVLTGVVS